MRHQLFFFQNSNHILHNVSWLHLMHPTESIQHKRQQIKNSFIYIIPVLIGNLIPIFTLPLFTRILSKEDFGALALAQAYGIFVTGLANFGLSLVYERNYFEYKDAKRKASLLYSILLFVISVFIICALFSFCFRFTLSQWVIGSEDYGNLLFWSLCAAAIMSLKLYYLTYFKNTENAKSFAWYTIDENLISFALSLIFIVLMRIGVLGIPYGQLIASLIVFLLLTQRFLRTHPFTFDKTILRDALKISYPLTPRLFLGVIGSQFDKYMIGLISTLGGVGIYSIGQKIANVVFVYMTAIQNVFAPQVYKRMFDLGEKGGESVGKYLTPFAYLSTALALLVLLFSEEVIIILTPEPYHGATIIVMILSVYYGFLFFGKQPQLLFSKKTYITSLLSIMSISLNILVNIPFIMKWGVMGAAWGTLLSGLLSGFISFVISQHFYRIKWEYKKIVAIYLILSVSFIVLLLMKSIAISYHSQLATKLALLAIYVLLGVRIKILTSANFVLLRNLIPKWHAPPTGKIS